MKRFVAIAGVTLVLASACSNPTSGTKVSRGEPADTSPIKIGVIGPMTGLASFIGKSMVEGVTLAVDDINASGGILGRQVEFVTRDDELDPAKTSTAGRELVEKEKVAALFGPAGTTNYLSIARLVQDNTVPTWAIMSGPDLTQSVNPYAFRAFLPDTAEIPSLAQFAATRYKKIAIIALNDAEGDAFRANTALALTKLGKPPVSSVTFAQDDTDFTSILLKIKGTGADAIISGTHLGLYGARIVTAMRNLGYKAQVLGVAGLISYTYPDLARDAANGTIFVSFHSWSNLPKDQWPPTVAAFYDRYVKRYLPDGELSATGAYKAYSTHFLTYDMVRIWAYAAAQARSVDPKAVTAVLNNNFTYPADRSVIGVPWTYTATNHDGIQPGDLFFYRWDLGANGKFTLTILGSTTDVLSGKVKV